MPTSIRPIAAPIIATGPSIALSSGLATAERRRPAGRATAPARTRGELTNRVVPITHTPALTSTAPLDETA